MIYEIPEGISKNINRNWALYLYEFHTESVVQEPECVYDSEQNNATFESKN